MMKVDSIAEFGFNGTPNERKESHGLMEGITYKRNTIRIRIHTKRTVHELSLIRFETIHIELREKKATDWSFKRKNKYVEIMLRL